MNYLTHSSNSEYSVTQSLFNNGNFDLNNNCKNFFHSMILLSLFSIFDPNGLVTNWFITPICFLVFSSLLWTSVMVFLKNLIDKLYIEMKTSLGFNSSYFYFFLPIFLSIITFNVMGLLPFVFTSTSHLSFSLALSLPFWFHAVLMGWCNKVNGMFSHLVPLGCPAALIPLMVLIELTSQIIRPLTLSVRLSANIMAGHSIMSLVCLGGYKYTIFFPSVLAETVLMVLEIAVAVIQPYVFFSLVTLYTQEVTSG